MVASTPDTGETCTEEGTLTFDLASEAVVTGGDYSSEEKTEMCPEDFDELNINLYHLE